MTGSSIVASASSSTDIAVGLLALPLTLLCWKLYLLYTSSRRMKFSINATVPFCFTLATLNYIQNMSRNRFILSKNFKPRISRTRRSIVRSCHQYAHYRIDLMAFSCNSTIQKKLLGLNNLILARSRAGPAKELKTFLTTNHPW